MKNKLYILIILISLSFVTLAKDEKVKESKTVEVTVEADGDQVTKKVIINGKELSPEEIKEFEDSGKIKIIDLDGNNTEKENLKLTEGAIWDTDAGEEVRVVLDTDGGKTKKKITINGRELNPDEIKQFEASGKMKVIHLNKQIDGIESHKMIFINSVNHSKGDESDIELILDPSTSSDQFWKSDDGKHVKILTNGFSNNTDDSGSRLGFMTMQQADGIHVGFMFEGSDAKKSGLLEGDLIKRIDGVDFTVDKAHALKSMSKLRQFKDGEVVKVVVDRDGNTFNYNITAQKRDVSKLLRNPPKEFFNWLQRTKKDETKSSKEMKVMVFNADDRDFKLNTDDINIVFPEELGDMNVFISDGSSTSKLLGKNHEMSSLSEDLGKYFNTKSGVLVLHVDDSNVFALKDGDVIKSINKTEVKSPKDVIKQLLTAKNQKDINVKVVRHKRNKTLKYNK